MFVTSGWVTVAVDPAPVIVTDTVDVVVVPPRYVRQKSIAMVLRAPVRMETHWSPLLQLEGMARTEAP